MAGLALSYSRSERPPEVESQRGIDARRGTPGSIPEGGLYPSKLNHPVSAASAPPTSSASRPYGALAG
jgi:hypothetical protein